MEITKLKTGLYNGDYEIYFCHIDGDFWFETKYNTIDLLTKDMVNFAHKIIWSNEWN